MGRIEHVGNEIPDQPVYPQQSDHWLIYWLTELFDIIEYYNET